MLLRVLPALKGSSCCFGSGDWPLDPHEILLHPRDLEALRVPAFGYVSISRKTTLQYRHADRGSSSAIDRVDGKTDEEDGDHIAFCRAVPEEFLQAGETKAPVWLLQAARVQPTQEVVVARAGAKFQSTSPQFRLELSLVSLGNADVMAIGDVGRNGEDRYQQQQRLSMQTRAIARRVRGCMVRPGSLLAAEVLGETTIFRVASFTDDYSAAISPCSKQITSSSRAKLLPGGDARFESSISSPLEQRYPVGGAASTTHDSNRASVPRVVLTSTEVVLVQTRSTSPGTQGTRRGRLRGRGGRPPSSGGALRNADAALASPCRGDRSRWSERAPGLEAALSELHALVLLSVQGLRNANGVLRFDRQSSPGVEKTRAGSPSGNDAPSHGSPPKLELPKKQQQSMGSSNDHIRGWASVGRQQAAVGHSSETIGARDPHCNDTDEPVDAGHLRWSDVLPAGIILCGPSGVGKTFALNVLSEDLSERHGIHIVRLLGPQILADFSGHVGSSGSTNRQATAPRGALALALDDARARAPSVLVIDELDALFDAIGGNEGGAPLGEGARASSALLEVLDRASETTGLAVLGATRCLPGGRSGAGWTGLDDERGFSGDGAAMPASYRKPGRFDRCVVVGPPTQEERERILRIILVARGWELEPLSVETPLPESGSPAIDADGEGVGNAKAIVVIEAWAKRLSSVTPGMVGGDLERLVRTARVRASQRTLTTVGHPWPPPPASSPRQKSSQNGRTSRSPPLLPPKILTWRDAISAAAVTVPRALRGMDVISSGGVSGFDGRGPTWESVGGFSEARRRLQRLVQWPWLHPEAFARLGISAPAGALLCGPSGCGKTLVARVLATECLANFVWVRSSELLSRFGDRLKKHSLTVIIASCTVA